ncbi:MAG: hypothetical protein MUD14_05865 [Hydrococcus sp. Prado102]|nr:hypothetical protein [Hydrococcus sp. Prado102]
MKAWLEYIRLEEMTSAEVEKGRGSYQKVFDSGVRLANNKLLFDSSLFEPLQQQYLSLKQQRTPTPNRYRAKQPTPTSHRNSKLRATKGRNPSR